MNKYKHTSAVHQSMAGYARYCAAGEAENEVSESIFTIQNQGVSRESFTDRMSLNWQSAFKHLPTFPLSLLSSFLSRIVGSNLLRGRKQDARLVLRLYLWCGLNNRMYFDPPKIGFLMCLFHTCSYSMSHRIVLKKKFLLKW